MARTIRRAMAIALCCVMTTLGVSPAFARALSSGTTPVHAPAAQQGPKGQALKKACVVLAGALRSDKFAKVLMYLQSSDAPKELIRTITKNAATIAKALDYVVTYEELTMAVVRDQVSHALRSAGVAENAAKTSAFWIQQVLGAALF